MLILLSAFSYRQFRFAPRQAALTPRLYFSMWAIEVNQPAANAYRLNNPQATVFSDDCNQLLQLAIDVSH